MPSGKRYLIAIALVSACLALQLFLAEQLRGQPADNLFVLPIALAAYFGGIGPGLLTTVISAGADAYFLMPPRGSLRIHDPADVVEVAMLSVVGVMVTLVVAELQRARRRAERNRIRQTVTLDSIGDAVVTTDLAGRILFMNQEAEALTEWSLDAVRGKLLDEAFPLRSEGDGTPVRWPLAQAMVERAKVMMSEGVLLQRRSGSQLPISDSCAPIRDDDGPVLGGVVAFRDRTPAMEAAAVLEESRGLQAMLARVAATAPGVLYSFRRRPDGSMTFPYASAGVAELFGLEPGALAVDATSAFALIHPDDVSHVMQTIAASAEAMVEWRDEFRVNHPRRGELWLEGHSMPTAEPDGSVIWFGFISDSTERKRDEEALRQNELRLASIIGAATDGMISVEADYRISMFNPAAERMFGCSASEAIGESLDRFIPSRFRESHRTELESFGRQGRTSRSMGVARTILGLRADGREFPIEASVSHITVAGRSLYTAILRDVEERTRAEAAVKESEERFQQLAGSIHEVFWMTDAHQHRVKYISPAYEDIWGRSCASLYASPMDWAEAIHPDDRERVVAAFLTTRSRAGYEEEFRILRPDGGERWIRDRGFPVRDESGEVVAIAGVAEDITERRQLEAKYRQTQKLESVGLLAGGVAHDFNNFLTVIAGESELLLAQLGPNDPARAPVEAMHAAGARASLLTRQLLAFSRQQVLEPKVLDLNQVVQDTERMLQRLLGEDILLASVLDPAIARIRVDPGHLSQVLLNLSVNARDAMPLGGRLTITTGMASRAPDRTRPHEAREYTTLCIRDTGIGMTPEIQAHLFEPFFTTKGIGKGTGLGLSVVHGIVTQSEGLVEVVSAPGEGTSFTLYFPSVATDLAEEPVAQLRHRSRAPGTEQLLVVEDEEPVRRLAVRSLRSAGYQVTEAADGQQAIELLNTGSHPPFDLLVTDLVMPNLSGRELAEELTRRQPGVRVLYTSGYTDDAVVRHGVQAADVAFLQKPYTPTELARKVRGVLDA